MRVPELPNTPIPPAKELEEKPRPLLQDVLDQPRAQFERRVDSLEFSAEARTHESTRALVEQVMGQLQQDFAESTERFLASSREEFDTALENHTDPSPRATADLILGGINGFVFAAFQQQNPDLTADDLETFREEAKKGVRRGYEEARGYLEAMNMFGEGIQVNAEKTIDLVLEGIDEFIDERLEAMGESPAEDVETDHPTTQ